MARTNSETTPDANPQADLDALLARCGELESRRRLVTDEIIEREKTGPAHTELATSSRSAALKLLNGEAVKFLPTEQARTLAAARRELADIDLALQIAGPIEIKLRNQAAAARIARYAPDYDAAMKNIAAAVLELELLWQTRDAIVKKIRPGTHILRGEAWPAALGGRLMPGGSPLRRFLEEAVALGWISKQEFDAALERAKQ